MLLWLGVPLSLEVVIILFVGMAIALAFGAIPGLGPPITIALMIPFLDFFSTPVALLLLGSTYVTGIYGGSISATLLNIPGTGASACTTLDGYPMSKQGKAITALSVSITASIIGGVLAITIVILATPVLSEFVLLFGSPEYFMMAVLGIAVIAVATQGNVLKGLIAGFFGLLMMSIGVAETTGEVRYTFGSLYLYDGVQFIPALVGIFALTEMMRLAGTGKQISESAELLGSRLEGIKDVFRYKMTVVRSSLIGLFVGAVPGAGGTVANFVAYGVTASLRRKPPIAFGDGNPEGIVASESSNNAMVSGSLIPTLTFGIPGNSTTAVMIGALLYMGLQPGPTLFSQHLDSLYVLFAGILLGCVFLISMYWLAPYFGRVTILDHELLIPAILVVSLLGAYSIRFNFGDLVQLTFFGLLGYVMIRNNFSIIALLLGIILGPTAEVNLYRSLQIGGGSPMVFLERPLSLALVLITVLVLVVSFLDVRQGLEAISRRLGAALNGIR
ncbi:tripartite tricarboxylate transporter permease [Natronosalvus rutilus]|uniref:Tripartite tricarboxylate transporter permease n=1 Tax=Natronosalvus rutilus TaxID=2953753 RepID=A0A9E7NAJ3_9EURY|nr:tripartite tricarboxylate transporter permease [Natronosalvus rutilus]UTF54809.1 tripartite tricarboxylate transporter permease [Natronosalvus rutilus]